MEGLCLLGADWTLISLESCKLRRKEQVRASHGGTASICCTCGSWELCCACGGQICKRAPASAPAQPQHQHRHQHQHQPQHRHQPCHQASAKISVVAHDIRCMTCGACGTLSQCQRCPTLELATSAQVRSAGPAVAGLALAGLAFTGSACLGYDCHRTLTPHTALSHAASSYEKMLRMKRSAPQAHPDDLSTPHRLA